MNSPRLARWILAAFLPRCVREAAIGDLEEGYAGGSRTRLWYWRQVGGSILPAIQMRWKSPGVLRIGAAAVSSYLVVAALVAVLIPLAGAFLPKWDAILWTVRLGGDMLAGLIGGVVVSVMVPMAPRRAAGIFAVFLGLLSVLSAWAEPGTMTVSYLAFLILAGPGCVMLGSLICGAGKRSGTS